MYVSCVGMWIVYLFALFRDMSTSMVCYAQTDVQTNFEKRDLDLASLYPAQRC
jgi:hypothetical protein